jgi:hypothetical protein
MRSGTTTPEELVDTYVFGGEAYVFRHSPNDYDTLRVDLATSLAITADQITVVGSAKTGFSMSPDAYGTPFRDESDVDVVVVDQERFDELWFTLLTWEQEAVSGTFRQNWRRDRRRDVYFGRFFTDPRTVTGRRLRRFRDISNVWFDAFQSVGLRHASLAGRTFSGRLYRTWKHARLYHVRGLLECYRNNSPGEVETRNEV